MDHEFKIGLKEFRDFGFLQEANRQFFHPLGLALSCYWDEEDPMNQKGTDTENEEPIGLFVQDWRYLDDEGGAFQSLDDDDSRLKAARVEEAGDKLAKIRQERFGWIIQPIGHRFKDGK